MDPSTPLNSIAGLDEGRLQPHVQQYIVLLQGLGYRSTTIRHHLLLISGLSRWLERTRHDPAELDEPIVERFLRSRRRRKTHQGERTILRRFCSLIPCCGVVFREERSRTSERSAWLLEPYRRYLVTERGLAAHTAYAYTRWADQFLISRFRRQPIRTADLKGRDLTTFVERVAPQCGHARAIHLVAALRSFGRFLRYAGHVEDDLETSVPPVAHWSLADLPKHLSTDQVERVLAACDRSTALGRRDYAIFVLLARLGLRAGEVLGLNLEDVDWNSGTVTIPVSKNRRGARLPLPADAGKAVAEYLRRDRPRCDCRRVFVRVKAPHIALSSSPVISMIAAKALRRAGVKSSRMGAHVFRHSFATTMLQRGASLQEIGQILRHSNPKTTAIYAKVDVETLRLIALPWPGGVR